MVCPFDNSYAALPERFCSRLAPGPSSAPEIIRVNRALAEQLGIGPDLLESPEGATRNRGGSRRTTSRPDARSFTTKDTEKHSSCSS